MSRQMKRALASVAVLVAATAASMVYAAWTTSGQGTGYAKATSSEALTTADAAAHSAATLYPGGSGDMVVDIENPNPFPIRVTDVTLRGTSADISPDAGHSGCSPSGVTFSDQTGLALDVDADAHREVTLSDSIAMSNASATQCQGAGFTVPVSITAHSIAQP